MDTTKTVIASALVTLGVTWAVKRACTYFNPSCGKHEEKQEISKALFFPDPSPSCALHFTSKHGCTRARCGLSHDPLLSYAQLLRTLKSGKYQLDVCIYLFTSPDMGDILIKLHKQGVKVRIITDDDQIGATSSQITQFRLAGIEVRHNESSYLMHHKYVIIDRGLLVTGSFNWTMSAVVGNNENLIITNNDQLVEQFSKEFERLWKLFDPKLKPAKQS